MRGGGVDFMPTIAVIGVAFAIYSMPPKHNYFTQKCMARFNCISV